jgi:tetratricopeptide (TPR) repeat protein
MFALRLYARPVALSISAVAFILTASVFLNSSVISFRLRELNKMLEMAAKEHRKNRSLGMLIQFDIFHKRLQRAEEDEEQYKAEAELQALLAQPDHKQIVILEKFLDPVAHTAISSVRFLMGKKPVLSSLALPYHADAQAGYFYERKRRYRNAIQAYEKVIEKEQTLRSEILLHLGFCYAMLLEFDAARALFQEVVRSYAGQPEASVAAKLYRRLELFELALRREEIAVQKAQDPFYRAKALFRALRYNQALEILKEQAKRGKAHPNIEEVLFLAGRCYEEKGEDSLAVQCYHNLVDQFSLGIWTKKANQRLLIINAFYRPDQEKSRNIEKVLAEKYLDDDFTHEISRIKTEVDQSGMRVAEERVLPREAAPARDSADAAVLKGTDVFLQKVFKDETDTEREARMAQWQEREKNFIAQQIRSKETKEKGEKQILDEASKVLGDAFSLAQTQKKQGTGGPKRAAVPRTSAITDAAEAPALAAVFLKALKGRQAAGLGEKIKGIAPVTQEAAAAEGPLICRVASVHAWLYAEPGKKKKTIGRLFRADRITVNQEEGGWAHVTGPAGEEGWIERRFSKGESELSVAEIVLMEKQARKEIRERVVFVDSVLLYPLPGSRRPIDTVYGGAFLVIMEEQDNMMQVKTREGGVGWLDSSQTVWRYALSQEELESVRNIGNLARQRKQQIIRKQAMQTRALKDRYRNRKLIQDTIWVRAKEWTSYYVQRLKKNPNLGGIVQVGFVITPAGQTDSVRIMSSTVRDKGIEDKVISIFSSLRYPPVGEDVGNVRFTYPIPFVPIEEQ